MWAGATVAATIENSLAEIPRVAEMVEALGTRHALAAEVVYDVQLALEEILTNAITHGYPDGLPHRISIRLTVGEDAVTAEVEDDGAAFNLLEAPRPNLTKNLKDRPVGGLGIHFVRTLMDTVEYSREEDRNRVVLRRRRGFRPGAMPEERRPGGDHGAS